MPTFEITAASAADIGLMADWAAAEGWNPGRTDAAAFFAADPQGFLIGRLDGDPAACVSAVRYGTDFGFLGFYITRPELRGQGYGMRLWHAAMERLAGRNVGLDGVVAQQGNYRKSGFRSAWNNIRYEGTPVAGDTEPPPDVTLVDARTLPFGHVAAYDRRFFPAPRDGFLAAWIAAPQRTALAAVRDGELCGLAVLRVGRAAARIGPVHADSPEVAGALMGALAATVPGGPVSVDVPDMNKPAVRLMEQLGLAPSFETARMYTGPTPRTDQAGMYGVTSLELG